MQNGPISVAPSGSHFHAIWRLDPHIWGVCCDSTTMRIPAVCRVSTGRRRAVDRLWTGCGPAACKRSTVCMQRVCSLYTDLRRIEHGFISLKRLGPVSAVRGPSALFLVGDLPAAFFKNQPEVLQARSFKIGRQGPRRVLFWLAIFRVRSSNFGRSIAGRVL